MSIVIVFTGKPSNKTVYGVAQNVIPFVGTNHEGQFAQMGIGLIFPDTGEVSFWGLFLPRALIQSWRGMKLLEQIDTIEHGTLCHCWSVASYQCEHHHFKSLMEQFGGSIKFGNTCNLLLNTAPTAAEIDSMLTILREKDVGIDSSELRAEIEAGRIVRTELIDDLMRRDEERQAALLQRADMIEKPVEPEESLGKLFADLGLDHFISGDEQGAYGFDWGHIPLEQVDQAAKRDSLLDVDGAKFFIKHSTEKPRAFTAELAPGVTLCGVRYGEIRNPCHTASDGTKYTFLSAELEKEHFLVETRVEIKGELAIEGKYTVPGLRDMIGPIPGPTVMTILKRQLRRLMSPAE